MKIEHLALWCTDIEQMRTFYTTYFDCTANTKYDNPTNQFASYFLSFPEGDCRIELMHRPDIAENRGKRGFAKGIAHFALEVGSKAEVDALSERLRMDGHTIASEPRHTGDGYYESAVLDPEGNYVELSAK